MGNIHVRVGTFFLEKCFFDRKHSFDLIVTFLNSNFQNSPLIRDGKLFIPSDTILDYIRIGRYFKGEILLQFAQKLFQSREPRLGLDCKTICRLSRDFVTSLWSYQNTWTKLNGMGGDESSPSKYSIQTEVLANFQYNCFRS
jgi:hypothetical protein